jgi:hypothetical protein
MDAARFLSGFLADVYRKSMFARLVPLRKGKTAEMLWRL